MQTGTISVQTENIFPIIKKYLYSDQEIFLRELVSNAVDATQKIKTLAGKGIAKGKLGDLTINIKLDTEARTLTISDKGVGMTHEEVEKYITQIAFSSAKEFAAKYDDANAIIGHFGLGFFSAFMVANKVEIFTKSYQDQPAVRWVSDGTTEYQIGEADKVDRGTDIVLHINEEGEEYLSEARIQELLTKYCRFLPVHIQFGEKSTYEPKLNDEGNEIEGETVEVKVPNIVNNPNPLWTKKPNDLTDQDYKDFYRNLYPMAEEPLFWIHLNVDYPFNLTGVLFFPKIKNNLELRKDRIHLYSNQVFVTDHAEAIVPDFLMLLHGVIDSPDIPLNVSRSYLQSDPEVKKINKYIVKKVADKLNEIFKNNRPEFEQKWEHLGVLIKYGMLSDDKFYDKAKKFCLVETTDNKCHTFNEIVEKVKDNQTDKDGNTILLYADKDGDQDAYITDAKERGYEVLLFDRLVDPHFIGMMEQKLEKTQFKRVDADTFDNLIPKDEKRELVLSKEQETKLKDLFTQVIGNEKIMVTINPLSPTDKPVLITRPEFIRRMKDMQALGGNNGMYGAFGDMYNVVINGNHSIVNSILAKQDESQQKADLQQLFDLARLQQNMLKGNELTQFVNRSLELMK